MNSGPSQAALEIRLSTLLRRRSQSPAPAGVQMSVQLSPTCLERPKSQKIEKVSAVNRSSGGRIVPWYRMKFENPTLVMQTESRPSMKKGNKPIEQLCKVLDSGTAHR